jgi:XTP/dITP diphosphohydrolase
MINVLIGTNNPGKFADAEFIAALFEDIEIHKPVDLGITQDVEETGQTYVENARLKRDFYAGQLKGLALDDYYVIGDDGGIEIDALNGEPGIHSRRWLDGKTPMTDQEIVDYCLERMRDVPEASRGAAFVGNLAVGSADGRLSRDIRYELRGTILPEASGIEGIAGYPFRALFYLPEQGKLLKDVVDSQNGRPEGFFSHREEGLKHCFEMLIEYQNSLTGKNL